MMSRKKKRTIIISIIGLLLILLILAVIMGSKRENVIAVQTEKVELRTITQIVTASGKIQPETEVKISAEVSGEIVDLPVREGQTVNRGDLVVRVRPDIYVAARDRAEAAFQSAQAGLRQATANLEKAEAEFTRAQELFDRGLVSDADLIAARTTYTVIFSAKETATYQVAQAKASLDEAVENLGKTYIYSPIDGRVTRLNSELGERVVGTGMMGGTEIMTIADLKRMEARVDVDENDVVQVTVGDTARIQVDAYPDRIFNGTVTEIAHAAKTRGLGTQEEVVNFEVKIRIIETDVMLRPGMSMIADIETATRENVLAVPIQSVTIRVDDSEPEQTQTNQQPQRRRMSVADKPNEIVFVVEDGTAKSVTVQRGIMGERYVEITEGLEEGAEVVSGSFRAINRELKDGSLVRIENESQRGIARSN
jgi:HlyD family secretion protein